MPTFGTIVKRLAVAANADADVVSASAAVTAAVAIADASTVVGSLAAALPGNRHFLYTRATASVNISSVVMAMTSHLRRSSG